MTTHGALRTHAALARLLRVRLDAQSEIQPNGCVLWTGYSHNGRYGSFSLDGHRWLVHVAAWVVANGPLPAGRKVLHRCDTPRCIRDACLFDGDQAANRRDMVQKGRGRAEAGIDRYNSKMTDDLVRQARADFAQGKSAAKLAAEFGICHTNMWRIVKRKGWKHVL